MKIADVIKEANPKKEFVTIEKGDVNLVMVFDHDALVKKNEHKIVRLYNLESDEETVTLIDTKKIIEVLIDAIQNDLDVKELLEEVFSNSPPDVLIETYNRILNAKGNEVEVDIGSTPKHHCCYSILINTPGKKTLEIPISGGRWDRGEK